MDSTRIKVETILQEAMLDAYNLKDVRTEQYDWDKWGDPSDTDLRECYFPPEDVERLLALATEETPQPRRILVFQAVVRARDGL